MAIDTRELTDEQLRDELVAWLREHLPAEFIEAIEAGDDAGVAATRTTIDTAQFLRELGEAGYATPTWPREYSGLGLDAGRAKVISEMLRVFQAPQSVDFVGRQLAGPTILQWGTDEQKARFLPPLARGEEHWCQLFSEPGAGSDLAGLATRATRDGDSWMINGQKVWTSGAHMSQFGLLMTRSDPDQPKHRGITYFICDMSLPGVDVRPLRQITGDSHFNEVFFTDVEIGDDMRLGPVNEGWRVSTTTLMNERTGLSGMPQVGRGQVDVLIDTAKKNGSWNEAGTRQSLISLLTRERVLQMTNLRAAAARVAGYTPGPEGSITKLMQSELSQHIANAAVNLRGVGGVAFDPSDSTASMAPQSFLYARAHTIAGGTSEIQRNIIGERVLALPKEPDVDRDIPWKEIRRSG